MSNPSHSITSTIYSWIKIRYFESIFFTSNLTSPWILLIRWKTWTFLYGWAMRTYALSFVCGLLQAARNISSRFSRNYVSEFLENPGRNAFQYNTWCSRFKYPRTQQCVSYPASKELIEILLLSINTSMYTINMLGD